MLKFVRENN